MLTTDQAEIALLDVRVVTFDNALVEDAPSEPDTADTGTRSNG